MQDVKNQNSSHNSNRRNSAQSKKKNNIIIGGIIIVIIIVALWMWLSNRGEWVCENNEWVMHGKTSAAMPDDVCISDDGAQQVRQRPTDEMRAIDSQKVAEGIDIRVQSPHVNQTVYSPLTITGEAKGWYDGDVFFVQLINESGEVIGGALATASEDVVDDAYVPFTAEIIFDAQEVNGGDIVFQKQKSSESAQSTGSFSFPVFFTE